MEEGFEWDDPKAAANLLKHGISFNRATLVFSDPSVVGYPDLRYAYGEARFIVIGEVDGELLVVVWTERGENIRIISARKANDRERKYYLLQNAS